MAPSFPVIQSSGISKTKLFVEMKRVAEEAVTTVAALHRCCIHRHPCISQQQQIRWRHDEFFARIATNMKQSHARALQQHPPFQQWLEFCWNAGNAMSPARFLSLRGKHECR